MAFNRLYNAREQVVNARGFADGQAARAALNDEHSAPMPGIRACNAADRYAAEHPGAFADRAEWSAYADGWFLGYTQRTEDTTP